MVTNAIFFTVPSTKDTLAGTVVADMANVNELSDSIQGHVNVSDLRNTLKREYGIEV